MIKRDERGYTMIEVISVLAIIGVLAASAARLVANMFDRYKSSRVADQIVDMQKIINRRYVADGNYSNLSAETLINEKLVGGDMRSGDNLVHAFGDVSVNGKANTFDVTFSDLPYNVCVTLANLNWIIQDSSDLVSLDINGTKYNWPEAAKDAAHQLPMDINRAMTSCTRDKESTITWEFQ